MFAFIDESHRRRPDGTGSYFFGVVLIADGQVNRARRQLIKSLPRNVNRFHFGTDSEDVRRAALKALAAAPVEGFVVYRADAPKKKAERARSKAMWVLMADLAERGITQAFFENRPKQLNNNDHTTIARIREAMPATRRIRYEFVHPSDEALLWLADTLAGAVGYDLHAGVDRYSRYVPEQLHRIVEA